MTSLSDTPAEIWQHILIYAIHVPVFLDPDGVARNPISSMSSYHVYNEKSIWNDEKPYWAAEKTRNACRRVCRLWDRHLQQSVGHRFVRVIDIVDGLIPPASLYSAVRISLSPYGQRMAGPTTTPVPPEEEWYNSAEKFLSLIPNIYSAKMQIISALYMTIETDHLAKIASHFPNLVTLINMELNSGLGDVFTHLPHLRHLYTEWYNRVSNSMNMNNPHLETLSFRPVNFNKEDFTPDRWSLPSLRTLRILGGDARPAKQAWQTMTLPLLVVLGLELRALYIAPNYLPSSFEQVLDACPNLEYLTVHKVGDKGMPPPAGPQLHTIMVPFFSPWMARPTKPDPLWPEWPEIRTIVFDTPWKEARWEKELRRWYERWKGGSISIEDSLGVKLSDWLGK